MPAKAPYSYNVPDVTAPTGGWTPSPALQQYWGALKAMAYPTVTAPQMPAYGYNLSQPQKAEQSAFDYWRPYLEGLGIRPLSSGYLTATSPAMRARMNPLALSAMQEYFTGGPKSWAEYMDWAGGFMPRTPQMEQRRWRPYLWR